MTFDTNWGNVQDREKHFPDEPDGTINATLSSILWSTLATGIGEITDSNWEEAWLRIDLWQHNIGPWFNRVVDDELEPIKVTKEDVQHAIGAYTNASRFNRTAFITKLVRTRYDH